MSHFSSKGLLGIKEVTNLLKKKKLHSSRRPLEPERSLLLVTGSFSSSTLLVLAPVLLCLAKPRELGGKGGCRACTGGTVLRRSVNLGSIRPPERVGFPAGSTQTCCPAQKNTLTPASRNASLPRLVKVSQNISASQCYTRRQPDSAFRFRIKNNCWIPTQKQK